MKKKGKSSKMFLFYAIGNFNTPPRRLNFTRRKDKRTKKFLNPPGLERLDLNLPGRAGVFLYPFSAYIHRIF